MSIYTRVSYIVMGILFIALLNSCGNDKSKSEKAKLALIPGKPIVFTADLTEGEKTYTAPWFKFDATITNDSDEVITVLGIQIDIVSYGTSANTTKVTKSFTAGSFNFTIKSGDEQIPCDFSHFAEVQPHTTTKLKLLGAVNPICYKDLSDPTKTIEWPAHFTVDGIPKPPEGSSNYRYTLKIKPLGWFGAFDNPSDRFEKTQTFYTQ